MRVLMGLRVAGGGARLLRACVLRSQYRITSTEASPEVAAGAVLPHERRAASSWSAGSGERSLPVARELGSPGFLQRALPDPPAGEKASPQQPQVARYFLDTQAMVRKLEEGGR